MSRIAKRPLEHPLALLAVNMLFRVLFQVWSGSLRELLIRPKQCVKRCFVAHKIADLVNERLSVSDYEAARDPSRMSGMAGSGKGPIHAGSNRVVCNQFLVGKASLRYRLLCADLVEVALPLLP